jgi:hypothetical protein
MLAQAFAPQAVHVRQKFIAGPPAPLDAAQGPVAGPLALFRQKVTCLAGADLAEALA